MLPPDVLRRAERRVGTTLCRKWHLDSVIGAGALGTVYAATHRDRRRVAIKVLHPDVSVDEQIRSRLIREAYIANTIDHPGVVTIIDDDEAEDGSAFLVTEFLTGESVAHRMGQHGGRLPLPEALWIADQLLDVLAAAHAKGVVHRDIKPDNLFVTSTGRLKVFDFGIAETRASAAGATRTSAFSGTPGYASPEQARARSGKVDERSDLYSVGAILFAMLTGRPVHRAESSSEALALTISVPASSVAETEPELPVGVVDLVDTALRYRREERWPNALRMQEATRRASGDTLNAPTAALQPRIEFVPQHPVRMEPLPQPTTMGSLGAGRRQGLVMRIAHLRLRTKIGGLVGGALVIALGTFLPRLSAQTGGSPDRHPQVAFGTSQPSPAGAPAAPSSAQTPPPRPPAVPAVPAHLTELRAARTSPAKRPSSTTTERTAPSVPSRDALGSRDHEPSQP